MQHNFAILQTVQVIPTSVHRNSNKKMVPISSLLGWQFSCYVILVVNPAVGCCYFTSGLWLPSPHQRITILAQYQFTLLGKLRQMYRNDLTRVAAQRQWKKLTTTRFQIQCLIGINIVPPCDTALRLQGYTNKFFIITNSTIRTVYKTRIPSGIWSCLYGWLLWMCVPRIGSFPSALNTWSKVWPWILIWACLIWNFAPIFGQQISILDPPYIGLFGLSWSYGWIWERGWGVGLIGPPTYFFCHGRR